MPASHATKISEPVWLLFEAEHIEQLTDAYTTIARMVQAPVSFWNHWNQYTHPIQALCTPGWLTLSVLVEAAVAISGQFLKWSRCSNVLIPNEEAVADQIYSRHELLGLSVAYCLKHIHWLLTPVLGTESNATCTDTVLSWGGYDQSNSGGIMPYIGTSFREEVNYITLCLTYLNTWRTPMGQNGSCPMQLWSWWRKFTALRNNPLMSVWIV